jgi:hypothetical protein
MSVLNLGVSFAVASFVALRAYDVGVRSACRLLKQIVQSPLLFLYPVKIKRPDAQAAEPLIFHRRLLAPSFAHEPVTVRARWFRW